MKAAELERVTAERDAARDLAIRLEGMLTSVEALHAPSAGEGIHRVPRGACLECELDWPCETYRLAHGTDA